MTIPTSGIFTSDTVRNEWGFGLPFTSTNVSQSAALNTPWTSEQLRGKSARTVRIIITSSQQVRAGGTPNSPRYLDRIVLGIQVTPAATPTSYLWGDAIFSTAATATFEGPIYDPRGFVSVQTAFVTCSVVVGGTTYNLSTSFTYSAGDAV